MATDDINNPPPIVDPLRARRAAYEAAFVEVRTEATLMAAAVIAAQFSMGEDAFADHARAAYAKASDDLANRRAFKLSKLETD